ncbi:rhodanese-like domain-containing protein [Rhodohalobacter halophilus]|uniref:rhodanese-like domain-containing protein n=1 Tax=Rhodohalobacter halophilus TaxID=1812810 RepID=UPI00083FBB9A|nr:rhodanese-like domain-containing protein [Rhodohalobacter halophilus]
METTAKELKQKRDNNESFVLLDVREPHEYYIADLDGTTRIPYDQLETESDSLDPNEEIVVLCRSGSSAADAAKLLEKKGFNNVSVLKGGINEWGKQIDPTLPQY